MKKNAIFIYSDDMLKYKFHDDHPFNQLRVQMTLDLLKQSDAIDSKQVITPRMATDEEIALIHSIDYMDAVKLAGQGNLDPQIAESYGLGTEDTPVFKEMHEASALLVGATLTACEQVMEGKALHALNLGGGLHHGHRGKASGFCVYNDCSIAIKWLREKYDARVLYIDTDAHHGDGVQWSFYEEQNVCTISIHETGRYLFPGTGNYVERGQGDGYGYSFNVPVDAFTEDESWLEIYTAIVREVAHYFKPDIILTQNGADAHYYDPLTHLSLTMKSFDTIPKLAHEMAHEHCDGKWIAVGGGGYDIWRAVPRAWGKIWLAMNDDDRTGSLPENWIAKWQAKSPVTLPKTWEDAGGIYPAIPRKAEITEKNLLMLHKALSIIK
ncbi:acetoin utilization protein AcuC [Pueribacillus theae]|uniref:Acetoin utilization protein AcuC n=1 Tax=Pueribacillus theae TaxID=2171751 RepID=A0A2U1JW85_9BACI|nr:acetoin utilization protein AcuC [Pueribacillus theae]PWA09471.1 acetoin utilization protein AcuC [Pueribacillus theae]